ncbi:hypothetical protein NC653_033091 [Populus alba x Populus x berolinensis]|uniref:Uncharacterized protein n=1 Tax=Populus alba x Populus x berolinensis TaxID=444605 RepID=A0AAD6LST5_9ROSI|nr:hypothetical protein NC653_033091 [Populus alba x Populus x berolinensis]
MNYITFEYDNPSSSRSVLMGIDAGNFSNQVPGGRQTSNNSLFNTALICSSFNLELNKRAVVTHYKRPQCIKCEQMRMNQATSTGPLLETSAIILWGSESILYALTLKCFDSAQSLFLSAHFLSHFGVGNPGSQPGNQSKPREISRVKVIGKARNLYLLSDNTRLDKVSPCINWTTPIATTATHPATAS